MENFYSSKQRDARSIKQLKEEFGLKMATLESKNQSLEAEIANLNSENIGLQAQFARREQEAAKQKQEINEAAKKETFPI